MSKQCNLSLVLLIFFIGISNVFSQTDKEQILMQRNASNNALKALDNELVYSFLTDDCLITTGSGVLFRNKEELKTYFNKFPKSTMYWIRTPDNIEVNSDTNLAWERGTWKGYDPQKSNEAIVGGKYAAMWTKASGVWLIKSQLFVSLN